MNPILYAESETSFTSQGIGVLSDAISCKVTEERNGIFELTMTYPITGIHFEDIRHSCILGVDHVNSRQYFRIYAITKPINGIVTIDAEHVSYQLAYIPVKPFTATDVSTALAGLKANAMADCPFTFWTDKSTVSNYKQTKPDNIRARLGGQQGSILDLYGGDFEWDNYTVKLWAHRGTDRGVTLRYGKNITDITQEENIASTYTSIVGYWGGDDGDALYTQRLDSEYASAYPYKRTAIVDFTSEYETAPTIETLTARARTFMEANDFGIPKVSIDVSFVQLWQTEEYKDIAPLERVYLCDMVKIDFEKLGISAMARVVKTVWNVLLERYDSMTVGNSRTNMSTQAIEQNNKIDEQTSALAQAVANATAKITGEMGGYIVTRYNADGQPYEMLIMDTDDINTAQNVWRWNQSGWGHSSTGYNGPYTLAATLDGGLVADFITAGKITGIEINNGNGTFRVDSNGNMKATSGEFTGQIKSGSKIDCGDFHVTTDGSISAKLLTNTNTENTRSVKLDFGSLKFLANETACFDVYSRFNSWSNVDEVYFSGQTGRTKSLSLILDVDEILLRENNIFYPTTSGQIYFFDANGIGHTITVKNGLVVGLV